MTTADGPLPTPGGNGPPAPARPPDTLFQRPCPRPHAALRLVCLPHAGGGASVFRGWAEHLPPAVELVAVQLPGRENRVRERPFTSGAALVDAVRDALAREVRTPYVLFGHSLGGMLAYALTTAALPTTNPTGPSAPHPPPERLILASCRAPDAPPPRTASRTSSADGLAAELTALAGTPPEVMRNRRLLRMLEPMLRADLELARTWPWSRPVPLPVPLTTFDACDDAMAPPAAVTGWRRYARRGLRAHHLTGGHFALHEDSETFLSLLLRELTVPPARSAPAPARND
ncbi:thioesterase II family protein [Streptomyces sp. NPDC059788]|uniref:thioesterase II family protein n=1 Tax=Streptomyces sp. NPDC059788 TaxID=3346948 RepID=UPI00364BFA0F